ncbi:MAG: hypothetical protein JXA71_07195 [Chitinispirillaceae bacterium]|nr:hypothetical protein [Chitinispirillaceae bacterium]
MRRKTFIATLVVAVGFQVYGQNIEGVNARIDAMGGSGPTTDIGWTIQHPAGIYQFANQVQGSACNADVPGLGTTYGSIIGIVGIADYLFIGAMLNNRMEMPIDFYNDAALLLNADHIPAADNAQKYPNLPKINICLKISDELQFGLGTFFEGLSYSREETRRLLYPSGADTAFAEYTAIEKGKMVRNDGAVLEARISIGSTTINPILKAGMPRVGGSEKVEQIAAARQALGARNGTGPLAVLDYETTYSSPQKHLLSAGSNIWSDLERFLVIGGVFLTSKRYQLNKFSSVALATLNPDGSDGGTTAGSIDSSFSDRRWSMADWWIAVVPHYADGFYFAPEYDGGIGLHNAKNPNIPADTAFVFTYHNFRLGMEKVAKKIGWFDEIAFRGGIAAYWVKEFRSISDRDPETSSSEESIPWKSYFWGADFTKKEAKITGGIGLKRGRASFDVSVDFLKWAGTGILSGPATSLATFTVDFGKSR